MRRRYLLVVGVVGLGLTQTVGCGSGSGFARIRAFHAISGVTNVDVYAGGAIIGTSVPYNNATRATYFTVIPGTQKLEWYTAGANPVTSTPLLTSTGTLAAGTDYTLVAAGVSGSTTAPPRNLLVADNNVATDVVQARIRVINACSSLARIDVYLTDATTDITPTAVLPKLSGLAYGSGAYITPDIASGSYRIRITAAGSKTVSIDSGTTALNFAFGQIRTAVALGTTSAGLSYTLLLDRN